MKDINLNEKNEDRVNTDPVFEWEEILACIEDDVKDNHENKDAIICSKCYPSTELSFIGNIQPWGKEKNSGNTIQYNLRNQENYIVPRQWSFFLSIPKQARLKAFIT